MKLLRNINARLFNDKYPIGSHFNYYPNPGVPDYEEVVTRSAAWSMAGGKPVVRVEGRIGGITVSKLEPKESL